MTFNKKEYNKEWHLKNKEHRKEYNKEWRLKNKEHRKEYMKEWYLKNPTYIKEWNLKNKEHRKEYQDQWHLKNKEQQKEYNLKNKEHKNEWQNNRRKTNPYLRLATNMGSAINSALKGRKKSSRTMKLVGCTVERLFEHLESCPSWESWMTRENYGRGGWDVDHIIAITRWCENCPLQFALCWDKSNLQPMEHIANLKKGGR
jgi:hypothetical protein